LSKDLEDWTGLPVAPYAGGSYGTYDDELVPIGGLLVRWTERLSTTHLYDGHNLHHLANWRLEGSASIGVMAVEQDGEHFLGLTYSTSFGR
jgi:hypothetical protein